ncbi:lysostaphin resistance A-like protein [Dactylosporangium sp. CS-033363]|uniref:CPBP family intramembrane glutamic endopeptidase n=1 Tax=Dactylosporangium sp. CS-033363 TaxID=3239935 RepID=UPI003D949E41
MDKAWARYLAVTATVGVYIGLGFWLRPDANTYLLLGIPITLVYQLAVARRPLRALWLPDGSFRVDRWVLPIFAVLIVGPLWTLAEAESAPVVVYSVLTLGTAAGAACALRVMERRWWRELAWMLAILAVVAVIRGDVPGAVHWLLFYLPAGFLVEEVLFRGALDLGSWPGAAWVSLLWGLWHLPILDAVTPLTVAWVLGAQLVLGLGLTWLWRRSGNLAAPASAHAILDSLRNVVGA